MTLSRIIIRLEIADTAGHFTKFCFDADNSAESSGTADQDKRFVSVCLDDRQIALYQGRRPYQKITMEVYDTFDTVDKSNTLCETANGKHYDSAQDPSNQVSPADTETVEELSSLAKSDEDLRPGTGKVKSKSSTAVKFFCGNPSVETTEGIVHLYREDEKSTKHQSSMICMLKVPATFSSQDLLQFIAPVEPGLEHIRIIRDGTPNQYMVLVKFKDQMYANDFYHTYNNQPFNSIEPEICHLAYVAQLESLLSSEGAGLQLSGATELPNCTVCLERMDESVKGILTILCNHSFHVACLAEWKDTSCPVCRCVQTPAPTADNKCFDCSAQVNLWICLICGFVGCGRYVEGHAHRHFKDTSHTYSMELGSNRVWDYAGDNYVHRLVQNKTDGKLVEVDERANGVQEEKIDALNLEVEELEAKAKKVVEEMTKIEHQADNAAKERVLATEHATKLEQQIVIINKERQKLTVKLNKLSAQFEEEVAMNRCLRENQAKWQERVGDLEERLVKKDTEVRELRDQLRDLMFFLEAKDTLASAAGATQQEIQEGQIIVQSPGSEATSSSTPSNKKGRSRKR